VNYTVEIVAEVMTCILSSIKIGSGIQTMFRYYLDILRGCSVGIINGKDLPFLSLR
jgi:hypothetical protein